MKTAEPGGMTVDEAVADLEKQMVEHLDGYLLDYEDFLLARGATAIELATELGMVRAAETDRLHYCLAQFHARLKRGRVALN